MLSDIDRLIVSGKSKWCNRCGGVDHHESSCLIPVIVEMLAALKDAVYRMEFDRSMFAKNSQTRELENARDLIARIEGGDAR